MLDFSPLQLGLFWAGIALVILSFVLIYKIDAYSEKRANKYTAAFMLMVVGCLVVISPFFIKKDKQDDTVDPAK